MPTPTREEGGRDRDKGDKRTSIGGEGTLAMGTSSLRMLECGTGEFISRIEEEEDKGFW